MKTKEASKELSNGPFLACGCPSSQIQSLPKETACAATNRPVVHEGAVSALAHWPVQIRLVPADAPFLKDAHLLVAADCTPLASPNFHSDLLRGRVVLLGCPKFDDVKAYVAKFTEIFRKASIQSVTTLSMEVPCCAALPALVERAMKAAGKVVPFNHVVVSTRGAVLERKGPGKENAAFEELRPREASASRAARGD